MNNERRHSVVGLMRRGARLLHSAGKTPIPRLFSEPGQRILDRVWPRETRSCHAWYCQSFPCGYPRSDVGTFRSELKYEAPQGTGRRPGLCLEDCLLTRIQRRDRVQNTWVEFRGGGAFWPGSSSAFGSYDPHKKTRWNFPAGCRLRSLEFPDSRVAILLALRDFYFPCAACSGLFRYLRYSVASAA